MKTGTNPGPWPADARAAVSLTFDDGAPSQLLHALPRLDAAGLRGTFYLNPGRSPHWGTQVPAWRQAAAAGHELGNHTTRHPCSCNYHFHPEFCLEKLTVADLEATIDEAEAALDELVPAQRGQRSFCYPCYQSFVGRGASRESYVPAVASRFRAARAGGERPNDPRLTDLHHLMSFAAEGSDADALIAYAETAWETQSWAVFTFHGVGGDHLSVTDEAFGALVDHLAGHRDRLWTDTVIAVADRVSAWRARSTARGD
jgi:peptidoglycan/xylan/chitin deacetylase (PgdA/CDA1 family)